MPWAQGMGERANYKTRGSVERGSLERVGLGVTLTCLREV